MESMGDQRPVPAHPGRVTRRDARHPLAGRRGHDRRGLRPDGKRADGPRCPWMTARWSPAGTTAVGTPGKTTCPITSRAAIPPTSANRASGSFPKVSLAHTRDLYTPGESKTSPIYNELPRRVGAENALQVRLDGPDGSSIRLAPPQSGRRWRPEGARITMVAGLLPHIRQFIRVRQALVHAEAQASTVTALLDNVRMLVQRKNADAVRRSRQREHTTTTARRGQPGR